MDNELKRMWVEALRSGEYDQVQGQLRSTEEGRRGFCCLGVLCHIAKNNGYIEAVWDDSDPQLADFVYTNTPEIMDCHEQHDDCYIPGARESVDGELDPTLLTYFGLEDFDAQTLMEMNDGRVLDSQIIEPVGFDVIANYIEENVS